MRNSLKPGQRIRTTGGIYGTISKVLSDRVQLRISDGVQIELAKSSIASLDDKGDQ